MAQDHEGSFPAGEAVTREMLDAAKRKYANRDDVRPRFYGDQAEASDRPGALTRAVDVLGKRAMLDPDSIPVTTGEAVRLVGALDGLQRAVNELEERLDPVLIPMPEVTSRPLPAGQTERGGSPLTDSLRASNGVLGDQIERLHLLIQRLTV